MEDKTRFGIQATSAPESAGAEMSKIALLVKKKRHLDRNTISDHHQRLHHQQ
jgi:hypothetical protein